MTQKIYKAIFFDWDGTAVLNRKADPSPVIQKMIPLLRQGVYLMIISGTSYENIAGGQLEQLLPPECLKNLYLGLGRGAVNYGFDRSGSRCLLGGLLPTREEKSRIDDAAYHLHSLLWNQYGLDTDIVFSRTNYCKVDLMVGSSRGEALFRQEAELERLNRLLRDHGLHDGVREIIRLAEGLGTVGGKKWKATTDAKFLELGMGTKSDNVDFLIQNVLEPAGIPLEECCFWGDEFSGLGPGVPGSDALMITDLSRKADFFDVSSHPEELPQEVTALGGQVEEFLAFLDAQNMTDFRKV